MAVFEYRGVGADGRPAKGIVDAESARAARAKLRKDGIFPTEVREESAVRAIAGRPGRRAGRRVSATDLAVTTRQLATLVGAAVPLVESLRALADQVEHPTLKPVLARVRERVNEGASLADALADHPRIFTPLYVNMVRSGEASGALDIVLGRLADFTEKQARLRGRLGAAMIYPIIMLVVGTGILAFLLTYVVPQITQVFAEQKVALPWLTRALLGVTDVLRGYWWLILGLIAAAALGLDRYRRTPKGREALDRFWLRLPVFGRLVRMAAVARATRTLSTLLGAGVQMLPALGIVAAVVDNRVLAGAIEAARTRVAEGESLSEPLRRSGHFPPIVTHMIAVGERSGELEAMLGKVADAYDEVVETRIAALTALLQPVMILAMGAVVLLVVLAILLPIIDMNTVLR
ncbi:MAG TPA: type II secretion system inner membrane protein GspF [Thermodesulfobacteriota bacterium]